MARVLVVGFNYGALAFYSSDAYTHGVDITRNSMDDDVRGGGLTAAYSSHIRVTDPIHVALLSPTLRGNAAGGAAALSFDTLGSGSTEAVLYVRNATFVANAVWYSDGCAPLWFQELST